MLEGLSTPPTVYTVVDSGDPVFTTGGPIRASQMVESVTLDVTSTAGPSSLSVLSALSTAETSDIDNIAAGLNLITRSDNHINDLPCCDLVFGGASSQSITINIGSVVRNQPVYILFRFARATGSANFSVLISARIR